MARKTPLGVYNFDWLNDAVTFRKTGKAIKESIKEIADS